MFQGNTIKLNEADYTRWQKAFKNIPNLDAVLQSRDDWLTYDADPKTRKRWYISTSAYLTKMDAKTARDLDRDDLGRRVTESGRTVFQTAP
jgi:hypothetical protein